MTPKQLQAIETELQRRGYKKWTTCLTSNESWAWFKTIDNGGYQIAFRVWDYTAHGQSGQDAYGLDFWTSAPSADARMDFTSKWEPICDIGRFEAMAADFNKLTKQYNR